MRLILPSIAILLAGCSAEDPATTFDPDARANAQAANERAADSRAVGAGFEPAQPEPVSAPNVDPVPVTSPGAALPPSTEQYRYIGRWAARPALCADGAWQFASRKLTTAGETSCAFPTVAAVPAGYELQASCQAEGTKTEQTLRVSFDDRRKTMRVAGRTLGPVELIYCGN